MSRGPGAGPLSPEALGLYVHVPFCEAKCIWDAARGAGFASLSVDLILGWPRSRWKRGLDALAGLAPDHVSIYVLEVEGK